MLLRGITVNALGDYYADNPALPTVEALSEADFAQIAALGFDAVRLVVSWSKLEAERGRVDPVELARVHQVVSWAGAHRLYVVIDMHQDAWGKTIATPPGVTCPPGSSPAIGWDGAPAWATLTEAQSTCRGGVRELSPAVEKAWVSFYNDTDGIQAELVSTWKVIAASFADDPAVAGYDLMNEPHFGLRVDGAQLGPLSRYYAAALAAVRAGEQQRSGGFAHLVFFEPMVTWFLVGAGAVPPAWSSDPGIVYAPHLYAGSLSDGAPDPMATIRAGFSEAAREASVYQTPWWSGEWGWFDDPATDGPLVAAYARDEDAALVGGAWWDWQQSCGDPHQIATPGAPPRPVSDGLIRLACPSGRTLGSPAEFTKVLSRPYPRASAGRLTSLSTDPMTVTADISGTVATTGTVELWVPGDQRPTVTGATGSDMARTDGGWDVTADVAAGAYHLHVGA